MPGDPIIPDYGVVDMAAMGQWFAGGVSVGVGFAFLCWVIGWQMAIWYKVSKGSPNG